MVLSLSQLFTCMLQRGYVPDSFGIGMIIPLLKDKSANMMNSNNYRGITLSSTVSKLFELCLLDLDMFGDYYVSSDLQFGFKKKL